MSDASDLAAWLGTLDSGLAADPHSVPLRYERAKTLDLLGRNDDAEAAYRGILEADATHFGALNDLARLLFSLKRYEESLRLYGDAVGRHPENPIAHANFAVMLLKGDDAHGARTHFERALMLAPDNVEAHRGLALALSALGETQAADTHRARGFEANPYTVLPYRGTGEGIGALMIVTETSGNVHFESMLDNRVFAITKVVAETEAHLHDLPRHDVVINAVGDADCAAAAIAAAARICARSHMPVINHPARILPTTRVEIARRLAHLAGVRTALTRLLPKTHLLASGGERFLAEAGFRYPLLMRAPGFHTGRHFAYVADHEALDACLAQMPGDDVLAIEFIDTRSASGMFCKYRAMFVDGSVYPLHAAIGTDWKVHYFSAEMQDSADHREHDRRFLYEMHAVLGEGVIAALRTVEAELALDYGGVDFALDAHGDIVIFEANATMVLPRIPDDARWNYRRDAVERVRVAATDMILDRAQSSTVCV